MNVPFGREDRLQAGLVVGIGERDAQFLLDAAVGDPLVVPVEAQRHGRELGRRDGHERRRRHAQKLAGGGDDLGRRRRGVVADVVDPAWVRAGDRSLQDAREVVHVDAAEHLARLMDALGGAGADLIEGAAPGAVDPGQAEDVERQAGHLVPRRLVPRCLVQFAPGALGRDPVMLKRARIDALSGLVRLTDDALEAAPRASATLLVLYGRNEDIVPRASREALLSALLLGQREMRFEGINESFRRIGLAHLLAISGLYLGVLAGFVLLTLRLVGTSSRWHGWVVILVVAGYLFLVEVRLPVLRAGIMTIFTSLALISGRRLRVSGLLAVSGVALLIWRPDQLFTAGFQLSYAVVLGLIHLQPILRKRWFGA
ncbi:MAG: ComEC/Rec2 family competence protein, partial [Proteobacteria bacterium]|nr:ComEC/Rec2 family competence protein [Pseudomonadota bacterium]